MRVLDWNLGAARMDTKEQGRKCGQLKDISTVASMFTYIMLAGQVKDIWLSCQEILLQEILLQENLHEISSTQKIYRLLWNFRKNYRIMHDHQTRQKGELQ